MSSILGSCCLVLHGHLPYVLRHGTWPHGEDWLFEAAAETYLPILAMIDECVFLNGQPRLTVGLTPILLEQLSHEHFKQGFERYLIDRIDRAAADRKEFEQSGSGHMAYLAQRWEQWYTGLAEQFQAHNRDIPAAFAQRARDGTLEILTSCATHAYLPLLLEDASIRAQVRSGIASSERILGMKPTGMWLPECAYRPGGPWQAPIPWAGKENRIAVEHLVGDEGVTHFFVEHQLIEACRSEQVFSNGQWCKVGWDHAAQHASSGWRSVLEPHGVNSDGTGPARVAAFARDASVCQQVWSGSIGYPASGEYLEFHKKQGPRRGLRYWKITGKGVGLGEKHPYYPDDVSGKIHQHARHFCECVKNRLMEHRRATGRHGVVTACFDAELFGHWWFEGPQFLRDVILTLNADPQVELCTSAEYLKSHPVDKVAALPEGSWGESGDRRVWTNEQTNWMWEIEYRCETLFGKHTFDMPWRRDAAIRGLLEKAARELLLMQASDWPFVIRRGQAVDYGIKRFMQHVSRFENLIDIVDKAAANPGYPAWLTDVEKFAIRETELYDIVFPTIDLNWWNM